MALRRSAPDPASSNTAGPSNRPKPSTISSYADSLPVSPAACKLKGKSGVSNLIPRERFQRSTKKTENFL